MRDGGGNGRAEMSPVSKRMTSEAALERSSPCYSEAVFDEVAKLIFGGKEPADLRPVGKIEFDCREAEQEISYRREHSKLNWKERQNGKEQPASRSE